MSTQKVIQKIVEIRIGPIWYPLTLTFVLRLNHKQTFTMTMKLLVDYNFYV